MPPNEKNINEVKDIKFDTDTEHVIVLDWDDTLLSSSALSSRGYRLDSPLERPCPANGNGAMMTPEALLLDLQLKAIEQYACLVITKCVEIASNSVYIITNAETGWVQLSAQKFIPGVVSLLSKVKIISARSTYESMFPDSPLKWKLTAVQEKILKTLPEHKEKNVLSIGDSHVEREAVRTATRNLPRTRTKTLKFVERPSMEQLRRQLELIISCFPSLLSHETDFDLQLTVTFTDPSPGNYSIASYPSVLTTSSFLPLSPLSASSIGQVPIVPTTGTPSTPTASCSPTTPTATLVVPFCAPAPQPLTPTGAKWEEKDEMVST